MTIKNDEYWMQQALLQAQQAAQKGEVPVGAVLVDCDNQLIAAAHNQPIGAHDPSAHAEIMVLRQAGIKNKNYRLIHTTLYVTLEPCVMCVGAMMHARVKRLVYGATEHKTGAIQSACNLLEQVEFNHSLECMGGVLQKPCADIMSDFFALRRQQKKEK
jgi:tRNA(adenine34) deaminase